MKPDAHQSLRVCPVSSAGRDKALDLAFTHFSPEERKQQIEKILSTSTVNIPSSDVLFGAYRDQELVGAIFALIQPGKTAQVWLPCLVENEQASTAAALLQAVGQWLDQRQVCVAQILLETVTTEDDMLIHEGGFDYLTDLLYLVSLKDDFPLTPVSSPLTFESYNYQNHNRLSQIVDSTYLNTLDCKKLNNIRKLDDVLEGYRATGEFAPAYWLIVRHENQDVGCLLMADYPQYENMELVYMGIIPTYRGRGWGMDVARHAQWLARQSGRLRLVLAVDASNHPALKMYAALGFKAWDQRRVYYRVFH
jgi:GNAT superfamily N-acetyltransferase